MQWQQRLQRGKADEGWGEERLAMYAMINQHHFMSAYSQSGVQCVSLGATNLRL